MKKLLLILLIVFILYILAIFKAPVLANNIEKLVGIDGFNQAVISIKENIDNIFTSLPTREEIETTISGAIDTTNKIKDSIDDVRNTLSGAVDTYNDVKETVGDVTNTVKDASDKLKETTEKINEVTNSINNTLSGTNLN